MKAATKLARDDARKVGSEGPITLLLAKWDARAWMRANLEDKAREHLADNMPAEDVETLIEQQITTDQATYLVEYFSLLSGLGCSAPDGMLAWLHNHNGITTRIWAELLIEKTARIAKLEMLDGRRVQRQQVAELLICLEKARRRMVMGVGHGEPSATERLESIEGAVMILQELNGDARACPKRLALLAEVEARSRWPAAPQGPRRKRRLERLLEEAYFGSQAKQACTARLDGTRVVLSSSDVERFMMLHMDPKLCRERLNALSTAGFLEEQLLSDDRCSTVRLFRPTERLEEAVVAGLEPLRALLRNDAVCPVMRKARAPQLRPPALAAIGERTPRFVSSLSDLILR